MVEISRTHRKIGNYVSLQVSRSPEYVTHIKNSLKLSQKGMLKLFAGEYELTLSQLNLIFSLLPTDFFNVFLFSFYNLP